MPHSARPSRFTRAFFIAVTLLIPLGLLFVLYVNAEKRIDRANDMRLLSFQLGDELRQSSDDLTRMARTYVVTGDTRYKQRYQAILDIRDGKKPLPAEYSTRVYWDLILDDNKPPRPETTQMVSLLDRMRQSGFSNPEMDKLTEAKFKSDKLAEIEMQAMKLSEATGAGAADKHAMARIMMYDSRYHEAKAAIMRPIDDFIGMMNRRTGDAVIASERFAMILRMVFIVFALWLIVMLWLSYRALNRTLGGRVEEVYDNIARIGQGDFSAGGSGVRIHGSSVMAWLQEMQERLQSYDQDRKRYAESLQEHLNTLTQPLDNAEGIQFTDLVNLHDLQRIQDAFAQATGVASIITTTEGVPITSPSNFCRLCNDIIRKSEKGLSNCMKSDCELGKFNPDSAIVQPCLSGGLWDGGASITVGGRHIANWLIGQVRNDDLNEDAMLRYADEIGVDRVEFAEALREVPVMPREQFEKVAQALFLLANQLSTSAYQNIQQARFIAERKKYEDDLRESEFGYRTLADSGQALIWKARTDKLCDYFNKVWLDFTGRTHEQEFGNGWAEGVHPDDLQRCLDIYVNAFENRESFSMDYRLRRHDGVYRWVQDDGCPRYDAGGNFIGYIGYCLDITNRKLVENELNNKNTELERFTYTVSHDLKSPLITIQSYAGMIERDLTSGNLERVRKDLGRIEGAAAGMSELLNDLLLLSRVGRQMNTPVMSDMNGLVRNTLKQLAGSLSQRGIEIFVHPDLPAVYGDEKRVAEVIQNLVENAIKYRGETETLSIEIGARIDGGRNTYFVKDNGIGIDARFHENIFGLFNKLDSKSAGTGVGLALVRRIMEVHGGQVWVESEGVGSGSTFCFSFPALHETPIDGQINANQSSSETVSGGIDGPQQTQ